MGRNAARKRDDKAVRKRQKQSGRSRSQNSRDYRDYFFDTPLDHKKRRVWEARYEDLMRNRKDAELRMAMPHAYTLADVVHAQARSEVTLTNYTLDWHMDHLDQNRRLMTALSEMDARVEKLLREKIPVVFEQFEIWQAFSIWLRKQPDLRMMSMEELRDQYTRFQKKYWRTIEDFTKNAQIALVAMMVSTDGWTIEDMHRLVQQSTVNIDFDEDKIRDLCEYALQNKFVMEIYQDAEQFADAETVS